MPGSEGKVLMLSGLLVWRLPRNSVFSSSSLMKQPGGNAPSWSLLLLTAIWPYTKQASRVGWNTPCKSNHCDRIEVRT